MTGRTFYWAPGSPPCVRAMLILEEKGIPYESKLLDRSKGAHKEPEVIAINPRGQVPTFKDGVTIVNQSHAIMQYLEDAYPEPALMPQDKAARGLALQRFYETTVLGDILQTCVFGRMKGNDDEAFAKDVEKLKAELLHWENHLNSGEYLSGPDFTLADAALGCFLFCSKHCAATLESYPNITAYLAKLEVRPSFVKTLPIMLTEATKLEYLSGLL